MSQRFYITMPMALALSLWMLSSVCTVNGVTCEEALATLTPCTSFVIGSAPKPSAECCSGARQLNQMTQDRESRRTVCQCFKDIAETVPVNPEKAKMLPSLCNINLSIPFDPNVDCKSIN